MEVPQENVLFRATLTNALTLEQWQITEQLAAKSKVHGKISLTSANSPKIDIFYDKDHEGHRIIIAENRCTISTLGITRWSGVLPGVYDDLVDMILTLGPSLIYRFDTFAFKWEEESREEIRGIEVQSFSATIGPNLRIIFFFKTGIDLESGLLQPVRVVFEDSKTGSKVTSKVILDIYSLTYTDTKLDELVEITPGIGCQLYFQSNRPVPNLKSSGHQIYVSITETTYDSNSSFQGSPKENKIEVYVDTELDVLRVNNHVYGSPPTETLYDYDLGIGYYFDSKLGSCQSTHLDVNTPGITSTGSFTLNEIFWFQLVGRYLGNVYMPNEWPFTVDCWESTQYNRMVSQTNMDKVVTTHYFATPADSLGMRSHVDHSIPIAAVKNYYKKDETNKFVLLMSKRRDFHDFRVNIPEEQYQGLFQIKDCIKDCKDRKTLALRIKPNEGVDGLKYAERNVNQLRESIKKLLTSEMNLSPLRIVDIDILFGEDNIVTAMVDISDKPKLEDSFEKTNANLDIDFLVRENYPFKSANAAECLEIVSSNTEIKAVVYCDKLQACIGIKDISILNNEVHKQISPKQVYETLLDKYTYLNIELADQNGTVSTRFSYSFQEIKDVTMDTIETANRQSFSIVKEGAMLNRQNPNSLVIPVKANSFSECYRACETSDQLDCALFSYCYSSSSAECLVAADLNITSDEALVITADKYCTVNRRNLLFNYKKISSRKFANLNVLGQFKSNVEDCASQCFSSADCHSFQYCNNQLCYSVSSRNQIKSNVSTDCDIYIPSISHQFKLTGSQLVGKVAHTEIDLTLDQCASFCAHWDSIDEGSSTPIKCKSINFCSHGEKNVCQLTGYTIQDANAQLTQTNGCLNYERIELNNNGKQSNDKASSNGASSIGLIFLFLVIGLSFGLVSPFVLNKLKRKYGSNSVPLQSNKEVGTFVWLFFELSQCIWFDLRLMEASENYKTN
uniref:Apple domain-containing protein n=1 Tax=Tetranychus urticae TaxID=32264 RepID=T1JV21_TETUR